ncbi:sigma-70 family RNA polymerase sigma factor [Porticoccaceae bacterium LTM1]|nr:sigma-70 family RNA polymerase sigma factor [Porticoccaceae bacterium LTM1]
MALMVRKKNNVVDFNGRQRMNKAQVLEQLFREHSTSLRVFLRGIMKGDQDVEDIVQEMFVKLSDIDDILTRLPSDKKRCRSYLFATANNMVVDIERSKLVRRRYCEQEISHATEEDQKDGVGPEEIAMSHQELERVKSEILKLKPRWRKAFILSRFKHLTYKQIANEMGVSVKQVEQYMKEALIRVRDAAIEKREFG